MELSLIAVVVYYQVKGAPGFNLLCRKGHIAVLDLSNSTTKLAGTSSFRQFITCPALNCFTQ